MSRGLYALVPLALIACPGTAAAGSSAVINEPSGHPLELAAGCEIDASGAVWGDGCAALLPTTRPAATPAQGLGRARAPRVPRSPDSGASSASAWRLVATSWDGRLYDVDLETGALSNPHVLTFGDPPAGLTTLLDGTHVVSGAFFSTPGTDAIHAVDLDTGVTSGLGPAGLVSFVEGDIDVDPLTGELYGMWSPSAATLLRFDPTTGAATPLGWIADTTLPDPSAMAFDAAGQLWVYSHDSFTPSRGIPDRLCRVNPIAVAVIDCVDLDPQVRAVIGGMDFHPVTGELYLVTGQPDTTLPRVPQGFYRIDLATGTTHRIAVIDPVDLSGLEFVPAAP